jgi:hypothetical protein
MEQITFFRSPLQTELIRLKISEDSSLLRLFRRKKYLNEAIEHEISIRKHGVIDNFLTILLLGEQGTFKSSVALCLSEMLDDNFKINNVAFLYEQFNNLISNSVPTNAFMLDEQVFLHGVGSIRIINDLQNIIETLRKRQNSMVLVGVEGKYFPEEIFTFVLETIDSCILGTCEKNNSLHEVRNCEYAEANNHLCDKLYVRLLVKKMGKAIGFYVQKIDWNNKLWLDYLPLKDVFLEKAKNRNFSKLDYEGIARELLQEPELSGYNKIGDFKLLLEKRFPNLTSEEKRLLARQIHLFKEGEKK